MSPALLHKAPELLRGYVVYPHFYFENELKSSTFKI
jgi:hypothetical protein